MSDVVGGGPPSVPEFQIPPKKTFRAPVPGDVIVSPHDGSRFHLGAQLGKGHFGDVYECRDDWGNELAAKVLRPPDRTYAEVQELWQREARNLRALRHPNVTYIHDAFECADTFYFVIERCSFTLEDLLATDNYDGRFWLPHFARDVLQAISCQSKVEMSGLSAK
jgi:serine/threonine-protein kinase